jgi:hypothetical protein
MSGWIGAPTVSVKPLGVTAICPAAALVVAYQSAGCFQPNNTFIAPPQHNTVPGRWAFDDYPTIANRMVRMTARKPVSSVE